MLPGGEVPRLLAAVAGGHALMARRLSGGGLHLLACIRLCSQDVDRGQYLSDVWGSKGGQGRTGMPPRNLRDKWQAQIEAVKTLHHQDLEEGFRAVYIPEALARKSPKACGRPPDIGSFLARERPPGPCSARVTRQHGLGSGPQQVVKRAAPQAGLRE